LYHSYDKPHNPETELNTVHLYQHKTKYKTHRGFRLQTSGKKYLLTLEAQIHKHVLNKMALQYEVSTGPESPKIVITLITIIILNVSV
jgi:hypothetical protein